MTRTSGSNWTSSDLSNFVTVIPSTASTSGHLIVDAADYAASTRLRTPAGNEVVVSRNIKEISPKLYFDFIKSKLSKVKTKQLKLQLNKLIQLLKYAEDLGQWALYDTASEEFLKLLREQEIAVSGYEKFVDRKLVTDYMYKVTDKVIKFKELAEFPRVIPLAVRNTVKAVKNSQIFDELWVLYIDHTKEVLKSTKQKIKEKDPILFGKSHLFPDRLFFIADWVDEYCDLVFEKLLNHATKLEIDYSIETVQEIGMETIKKIKKEVLDKQQRLRSTNSSNFRNLMKEDDRARAKDTEKKTKPKWWKIW